MKRKSRKNLPVDKCPDRHISFLMNPKRRELWSIAVNKLSENTGLSKSEMKKSLALTKILEHFIDTYNTSTIRRRY